jgi:N utilization substance protein A
VVSKDKDVDAVGACVGMKGMRVQSIIRELRGEKIDIIEYHEDPATFAEKALQPAKVSRVTVLDTGDKHLEVVVDDSQLSLAIGKKGQNVRLAAKLLGWKIDIKSEEEKRQEVEQQMTSLVGGGEAATPLDRVVDLGEALIAKLNEAGITTVEALADMTPEQLEELPGIGPKTVEKIFVAVNNYFSSLEPQAAAADAAPGEVAAGEVAAAADATGAEAAEGGNTDPELAPGEPPKSASAEALESGQAYEAEVVAGVESAPDADVAEVHVHGEESQAHETAGADNTGGEETSGEETSGEES